MPAALPHVDETRPQKRLVRPNWNALRRQLGRGRSYLGKGRQRLNAAPPALRLVVIAAMAIAVFAVTNLVYQVLRKPTEIFFPISGVFNKAPAETWRRYAVLFREYSTASVTPELLAALAQVESMGNPLARTYWRWRLTWNPFAIYQPASSAVGMYQMTDAAFAEARRHCITRHVVVEDSCGFSGFYTRILPSHAVELTAVLLDRGVAAILGRRTGPLATPRQKQELAAIVHLCGAGPASAFARRGFHPTAGERCGDHDVAAYLAQVDATRRQFLRLAADW
jgi:hypothetical protein